jgi:hypothetical protein
MLSKELLVIQIPNAGPNEDVIVDVQYDATV